MLAVNGSVNRSTTLTGSENDFFVARNWRMDRGRDFTDNELRGGKSVCILGSTVADELFGAARSDRTQRPHHELELHGGRFAFEQRPIDGRQRPG